MSAEDSGKKGQRREKKEGRAKRKGTRERKEERGTRKEKEEGGREKEGRRKKTKADKRRRKKGKRRNFCWEGAALGTVVSCSGRIYSVTLAQLWVRSID